MPGGGLHMEGETGELRVGYEVAAQLARWTYDRGEGDQFTVQCTIAPRDSYWMDQGPPYTLRLHLKHGTWQWREVQITGREGTITVYGDGRPEVRKE